jgi:hypothetical protein
LGSSSGVVIAAEVTFEGFRPGGSVELAPLIARQGAKACGGVVIAGAVGGKRVRASGRIFRTCVVGAEGISPNGSIVAGRGVLEERGESERSVVGASCVLSECIRPQERVGLSVDGLQRACDKERDDQTRRERKADRSRTLIRWLFHIVSPLPRL